MVNFRYHIVSITAVFLALAIGLAMGTTVIDKATLSTLKKRLDTIEGERANERKTNAELRDDLAKLRSTTQKLGEQATAQLLGQKLDAVPVMLVATRGVDTDSLDGLRQSVMDSGAAYAGTLWLTDRLQLDDANEVDDLAGVLGIASGDADRARRSLSLRLADVLQTASLPPITTTTTEAGPADGTTTTAGTPTSDSTSSTPTTVATPLQGEEPTLLRDLRAKGFLDFDAPPGAQSNVAGLPAGVRYVVVSGPGAKVDDDKVMLPMLREMAADGSVPAVAAQAGVGEDEREADASRTVFVGPIRDDDTLKSTVSTVDDLEQFAGWAATVLALADYPAGPVGHYGIGKGADRLLPAPANGGSG
jgi:hypothetical protein